MTSKTVNQNMKKAVDISSVRPGFSLAEVLAALTIGAMVIVAVLGIYYRAEHSASAAIRKLEESQLPGEVLQYIAEDLDRMISSNTDTKVTIQNKLDSIAGGKLIPAAKLTISRTLTDTRGKEHIFEEITWQSSYNIESLAEGLVLYRSHSGINLEDKVLQQNKYDWERELFVPICSGITFFNISAITDNNLVERWDGPPPTGIVATISFAEPYKNIDGSYGVPDEDKITRTIAIDRTRKIRFDIAGSQTGKASTEATEATKETGPTKATGAKRMDLSGDKRAPSRTVKPAGRRE